MPSEAESWGRLKELVGAALELAPDERHAFLERESNGDRELLARAEEWLHAHDGAAGFLEEPVHSTGGLEGQRVDDFLLHHRIGEGGMGSVYEATQSATGRKVAVKLMKHGLLAADARRRFQSEIALLARLRHPAIAQIHDAGLWQLPSGPSVPWLAMELVLGQPLTRYAQQHGLGLRARIELFLRVAAGVSHAHQRGVIHRDLKPDNILVEADEQPKVLDFGLARAVREAGEPADSAMMTAPGTVLGTLPYMSPEQVSGNPDAIDARTDVYALGVILYELLTRALPIDVAGQPLQQALGTILWTDPVPAARRDPALRGDLDTILAKALEKDPQRRYQSASELAGDLERHLRAEPIAARSASAAYNLMKFARRNRVLVGGIAVALVLLVLGLLGTSFGLLQARRSEREATRQRDAALRAGREVLAFSDSLQTLLAAARPRERAAVEAALARLEASSQAIDGAFADQPLVRAALDSALGWSWYRLQRYEHAAELLRRAVEVEERELGAAHPTTLDDRYRLAEVLIYTGALAEAEALAAESLALAERDLGPADALTLRFVATQASAAHTAGDLARAETLYQRVVAGERKVLGPEHVQTVTTLNNLALVLDQAGEHERAAEIFAAQFASLRDQGGLDHPRTLDVLWNLALARDSSGAREEAIDAYRTLLAAAPAVLGPEDPKVARGWRYLAVCLRLAGRNADADEPSSRALESSELAFEPEAEDTLFALNERIIVLMNLGRFAEAEPLCRRQLEATRRVYGEDDMHTAVAMVNSAAVQEELGELAAAEELLRAALAIRARESPAATLTTRNNLAKLMQRTDPARALPLFEENYALAVAHQPEDPLNERFLRYNLARCLAELGRDAEAEQHLLGAYAGAERAGYAGPVLAEMAGVIAEFYTARGRADEAQRWRGR